MLTWCAAAWLGCPSHRAAGYSLAEHSQLVRVGAAADWLRGALGNSSWLPAAPHFASQVLILRRVLHSDFDRYARKVKWCCCCLSLL